MLKKLGALLIIFGVVVSLGLVVGLAVAQTVTTIPISAPLERSYVGATPMVKASDVSGCADQASGGDCEYILGGNLDTTLQAVNGDIRNARQAIQIATDDASDADGKAAAAQALANTAQGVANTAQATANTAQTTANTAQTTAGTAQGVANTAQATADTKRTETQVQTAIDTSLATFQEPGGSIVAGSIAESKFTPAVVAKLNKTAPEYRPGVEPYRFQGSTRIAAVDAREEYYLGEVALSQAYVNIYSSGNASRIRVTLDDSTPEQVGSAGNSWNLVLGQDHGNTSVTISPDTPKKTFTLRLPSVGISLSELAHDLDNNTRLNAEVVGNDTALVNYAATWGPNPAVGSLSPFGNGGDQSTTSRTAWRAFYEANSALTITLDYGILEEYQVWSTTAADWQTVVTLVDPPLPVWSAGSSANFFSGGSRTAAVAARDLYSLRNTGVTQATRLLPLGTSTTVGVLVTLSADNAVGTTGNGWTVVANGSAFAGSNSALAYDTVNRVVGIDYNATSLTAQELAHLFNVTPGFSAALVGGISETAIGFIAAQIAGAFAGGVDAALNPRTVWIQDYDDDSDQYISLAYGQILERQVRRNSQWATVDTINLPKATPAGVRLLTHPNAAPGINFQWWQNVTNSAANQSFIERTGGTIQGPQVGSQHLSIPATNSVVYFRVSDGTNTVIATLAHLVLPDGSRVSSAVTVTLGSQPILLTILSSGRVVGTRPTAGTTNTGLDAWVQ